MMIPIGFHEEAAFAAAGSARSTAAKMAVGAAVLALAVACSADEFSGCEASMTCGVGGEAGAAGAAGSGQTVAGAGAGGHAPLAGSAGSAGAAGSAGTAGAAGSGGTAGSAGTAGAAGAAGFAGASTAAGAAGAAGSAAASTAASAAGAAGSAGAGTTAGAAGAAGSAGAGTTAGAAGAAGSAGGGAAGSAGVAGRAPQCSTNQDCDNADPCDGAETCDDGACLAGTSPCAAHASEHCEVDCTVVDAAPACSLSAADEDGDGHGSALCARAPGLDCDDTNNAVYPGAVEVCFEQINRATLRVSAAGDSWLVDMDLFRAENRYVSLEPVTMSVAT